MVNSPHFMKADRQVKGLNRTNGHDASAISTRTLYRQLSMPVVNSQEGTTFFWIRLNETPPEFGFIYHQITFAYRVILNTDSTIQIIGENAATASILDISSSRGLTHGVWTAVLASWDLAAAGTTQMYFHEVGGTEEDVLVETLRTDDTIAYDSSSQWTQYADNINARRITDCDFCQTWFDNAEIDFTTLANRRQFITADGQPVDLGDDGALTTSVTPELWVPDGNPAAGIPSFPALNHPPGTPVTSTDGPAVA